MLTITGSSSARFCDGLSRRNFLRIGALGSALTLADMRRLQAQSAEATARPSRSKGVIVIFLSGGASQLDTYDLKPDAPREIRGPYNPIRTNVPGIDICEWLPETSRVMDKIAVLRSVVPAIDEHSDSNVMTGFSEVVNAVDPHPCIGSVVSKYRPHANGMPGFVSLRGMTRYGTQPASLGLAHRPFTVEGPSRENLTLPNGLTESRVSDRRALLASFDSLRREIDATGTVDGMDAYTAQAFDMIASGAVRRALDVSQEPQRVRDRFRGAESVLLARRLVEAGVGCVTLSLGGYWDHHYGIFKSLPSALPTLDRGVAALAEDLSQRGLDEDISVVVWGEFGRSPRINHGPDNAGRDHWAPVMSALVMGGGMRMGQVIGSTNSRAEYPREKPYSVQRVLSTLYHSIGINPSQSFLSRTGRPMSIAEDREPIPELIG
ncbi:MAG: DUF1501 domain-containing protein [Planctomycetota bacterium]